MNVVITSLVKHKGDWLNSSHWKELEIIRLKAFSKIHHKSLEEKYVVVLMTRVTELCQDAFELIELKRNASIPIILRSAVESYIDLRCVLKDKKHIYEMNNSYQNYVLNIHYSIQNS